MGIVKLHTIENGGNEWVKLDFPLVIQEYELRKWFDEQREKNGTWRIN